MTMSHMQNSSNMVNPMGPSFAPQSNSSALVGPLCSICSLATHATDSCPYLNDGVESCNAIYPSKPMTQGGQKYDPYSNTYNPGWRDHLIFDMEMANLSKCSSIKVEILVAICFNKLDNQWQSKMKVQS